jgi:hypothetical protein
VRQQHRVDAAFLDHQAGALVVAELRLEVQARLSKKARERGRSATGRLT